MDEKLPVWCEQLLGFPDEAAFRLYQRGKSEQWKVDVDIDWDALDLSLLPVHVRRAMASIYTQLQYGEMFGLVQTAGAVSRMAEGWARMIGATQVTDEARHVEFFSRVVVALGEKARVSPRLVEFAETVAACDSTDEAFLGTQVVLEGFAQAVFVQGSLLASKVAGQSIKLPGTDVAVRFLRTIGRYIGADEARHVAFGVRYLRQHWSELSGQRRDLLQRHAEQWSSMLDGAVEEMSSDLAVLGISKTELSARVLRSRALHFHEIGFEGYQEPVPACDLAHHHAQVPPL